MNRNDAQKPIPLGQTVISDRARQALHPQEVLAALWNHAHQPWGECFSSPEASADRSLASRHFSSRGLVYRIITEDQSTIVYLLDERKPFGTIAVDMWALSLCPTCGA